LPCVPSRYDGIGAQVRKKAALWLTAIIRITIKKQPGCVNNVFPIPQAGWETGEKTELFIKYFFMVCLLILN